MDEFFDKVKGHAYKAKDEAAKFTKQVVGKTNNIIAQTKLSFALNETESKIKEIYSQIGKMVYDKYQDGESFEGDVLDNCLKISELKSEANDLKEKIAELKEYNRCPECGEHNKKTASFCWKCGCNISEKDNDDTVRTDMEEAMGAVIDKVGRTVDDVQDAVEMAEEKIKKVVTIKPKKPDNKDE